MYLWLCKWAFVCVCVCMWVVFLVCGSNFYYPICELTRGTFRHCLPVVWLDWGSTERKPEPLHSAVMCRLAWTFIGSDWSAFRHLTPMSIFKLMLPGFLCWHTIYFDYFYFKNSETQGCMSSVKKRPRKQLLDHQRTLKHARESQTNEGRPFHGFCSSIRHSDTGFIKTSHTVS